ncbi:MAG: virulence RhuM family protein [Oscillospiraceae bacterium]|nr:virulence RhuM family protein [Oscillospiraceae bacterium]
MSDKKRPNDLRIRNSTAEFLIFAYQAGDGGVEVRVQDGMVWLSQKLMGQLFDTSSDNIGLHLKNIFKDEELKADSVTEDFSATATDGRIVKSDVSIAKNYLTESELQSLSMLVNAYLDLAERRAMPKFMKNDAIAQVEYY